MDWNKRKRFTAGLSVVSNTVLVLGKFIVGFAIGSVSVISEAVHSSIDLMAAIVAFIAVGESSKPPDKKHPFGHGKAEGISGAFEGLLIFLAIIIIVIESVKRIISGGEIQRVDWGLAVMAVSAIMNAIVSRQLFKVSKKTDSLALEADALHLSTDVLTSVGVFVGLLLIKFTGIGWLDPLIALGVAVVIGHAAYGIVKRSIKDLMDEELSEKDAAIVEKVLQEHHPYFVGFHNLRSRKSGNQREIDLHLVQCRHVNLQDAHLVCDHLEQELRAKIPTVNITIHVEPCEDDCINSKDKCKVDIGKLASHISDDPSFTGKEEI